MANPFLEIRPYKPADHKPVVALWGEVFKDDPPWNEPVVMIRTKLTVRPGLFLVAVADREVIATVMAGFDGVRGWIHHLAVEDSYRRQGIASALMGAAENLLRDLGCPKVNLQVRETNKTVIDCYRSIGYEVEEIISLGKRQTAG